VRCRSKVAQNVRRAGAEMFTANTVRTVEALPQAAGTARREPVRALLSEYGRDVQRIPCREESSMCRQQHQR